MSITGRYALVCAALLVAGQGVHVTAVSQESAAASHRQRFGDFTVIYSAVRADTLSEESARRHGLPARADVALVNVTVRRDGMNIPARVQARATNLAEQQREIEMDETVANDLVAYTGVVEIADREVLDFEIDVLPEGADRPVRVEFRETFVPRAREAEAAE